MKIYFICALLALSGIADAQSRTLLSGLAGAAIGYGLAQSQQQRGFVGGAPYAPTGIVPGGVAPVGPFPVGGGIVSGPAPIGGIAAAPIPAGFAAAPIGPFPIPAGFAAGSIGVAPSVPLVGPAPVFTGIAAAPAPVVTGGIAAAAPFVAGGFQGPTPIAAQSFQTVMGAPASVAIAQPQPLVGVQQIGLTAPAPTVSTIAQSIPVTPAVGYHTSTIQAAPAHIMSPTVSAVSSALPVAASYESAYIAQPQATYVQEQSIPSYTGPAYASTVATTAPLIAGATVPAHYHYAGGSQIACAEPHAVATAY